MSKVAEAMKVYEIYLEGHNLDKARKLLDDQGYFVVREETSDPEGYKPISKLIVEGLVDPIDVFEDIKGVSRDGKILYYVW